MNLHWKTWLSFVVASACVTAHAQTNPISGKVESKLVLTSGCAINAGGSSGSVGASNFGTLDFGSQPSGFTGSLRSAANGSGSSGAAQITCSPDVTAVQVTVDAGLNGGKGASVGAGTRALGASGGGYVPYEVYADKGSTTQYVSGTAQTIPVPTPGTAFDLPIYGVANKTSMSALAAGTYTDELNVTLGW